MELEIFLRDRNNALVNAWLREFENYENVSASCGDIFDIKADAIISPANSFGFMDGGIDLAYSKYFGWSLQKKLQKTILDDFFGELPVGSAAVIETGNEDIKYLLSCPTMRVPENVSNTVNAFLAFRAGLIEAVRFNKTGGDKITSIVCPGLGTLTGRISPANCARQMKDAYDSIVNGAGKFPGTLREASNHHYELMGLNNSVVL